MEYIIQGASIECIDALIISRDIKLSSVVDIPEIGMCRKYNCKRNSEAAIISELTPKKHKKSDKSRLDSGDSLKAEDLIVIINNLGKLVVQVVPLTGRHKAQKVRTGCYTYAEITQQFPNIREIKDVNQLEALKPLPPATKDPTK